MAWKSSVNRITILTMDEIACGGCLDKKKKRAKHKTQLRFRVYLGKE